MGPKMCVEVLIRLESLTELELREMSRDSDIFLEAMIPFATNIRTLALCYDLSNRASHDVDDYDSTSSPLTRFLVSLSGTLMYLSLSGVNVSTILSDSRSYGGVVWDRVQTLRLMDCGGTYDERGIRLMFPALRVLECETKGRDSRVGCE
jgi:hypothetical protein